MNLVVAARDGAFVRRKAGWRRRGGELWGTWRGILKFRLCALSIRPDKISKAGPKFCSWRRPEVDKNLLSTDSYPTQNHIASPKMKRKLDANDEPAAAQQSATQPQDQKVSFSDFGLDPRLVQAVAQEKYREPTLVQSKAIPLALEGKDVLAKAKTGSGKTAAYLLPVLQSILKRKQVSFLISRAPKPHL